jgi:hypothetical protein
MGEGSAGLVILSNCDLNIPLTFRESHSIFGVDAGQRLRFKSGSDFRRQAG